MQTQHTKVSPLKKISMRYTGGATEDINDLISEPAPLEFIFGLGTDGLTPFEYALEGKVIGDKLQYRIERSRIIETFGHLLPDMGHLPPDAASFYLNVEITDIGEPGQRELVRALAATTACGGDCDCGCASE